jgi:hypothetical protein
MRWIALFSLLAAPGAGCTDEIHPCATPGPGMICPLAGTGSRAFNGDGLHAMDTDFYLLSAVEPDPAGVIHLVDFNNQRIRRIEDDGSIATVVGSGMHYYASTGGPAVESALENPIDMEFDPSGQLVFVSLHDPRVLYVDQDGYLWSMAGTGEQGDSGDGGPALSARFVEVTGIAIGPEGSVYVSDSGANRVRVIRPEGTVEAVAGTGQAGLSGDGGPGTSAELHYPTALAVAGDGSLYIADSRNHAVRRVDSSGMITTIAGTGEAGFGGDGGPAASALLDTPEGLAFTANGSLLVSDWNNHRIRRIAPDGTISTLAGTGEESFHGDGGPAIDAALAGPARLSVRGGVIYIADQLNSCARMIYLP